MGYHCWESNPCCEVSLMDLQDCVLPIVCRACRGAGSCYELVNNNGAFSLETCTCPRCEGSGHIDVFGDKVWDSVTVKPKKKPSDIFLTDKDLLTIFADLDLRSTPSSTKNWWLDLGPW